MESHFHFSSAGVKESAEALRLLRNALEALPRKNLLMLEDNEVGEQSLLAKLPTLLSKDTEMLLFGYASAGRARLLTVLLNSGLCNVNAQRLKDGCTALHLAYFRNHSKTVEVLKSHGADATIVNKYGEVAEQAGKPSS